MNKGKFLLKVIGLPLVIGCFFCFIPVLISFLVFCPNFEYLNKIPGTDEQWFSFWASYSGAAVTIIIAVFTYYNSKSISEQEKRFLKLFTGYNLRISKFIICQYDWLKKREETYGYRISLKFINLSYSMIEDIKVRGFYIRFGDKNGTSTEGQDDYRKVENGVGASSYLLQGDAPYLTFDLIFMKDSEEGKKFTDFYNYDYNMGNNKLDVRIDIETTVYESDKKEIMTLDITLLMTSHQEEEWGSILYSSEEDFISPIKKVLIYCYTVRNAKDKKLADKQKKRND